MSASTIIFYILAALTLTFGALTVFSRKIFRAAVFLLLSLICIAGIYILMEMDFVAALQIVIYVGGIVVLIIFSIFLTQKAGERLPSRLPKRLLWAILLPVAGLAFSSWVIFNHPFAQTGTAPIEPTVHNIGLQLLNYDQYGYVLPFEAVSILLLASLVGSIIIAMKKKQQ
ncbi:MAG: NADH-quinone oxidoreductase subunit J [Bacteroidota bacterium]|nr:NADH-quinone oxidoreductase subunit J [Bacteroidota bacterium]